MYCEHREVIVTFIKLVLFCLREECSDMHVHMCRDVRCKVTDL